MVQLRTSWMNFSKTFLRVSAKRQEVLGAISRSSGSEKRLGSLCCAQPHLDCQNRQLPALGHACLRLNCRFLEGQAVLQASVAELVDRPDRAQDAAAAGVVQLVACTPRRARRRAQSVRRRARG
jgi:hypothetical protein